MKAKQINAQLFKAVCLLCFGLLVTNANAQATCTNVTTTIAGIESTNANTLGNSFDAIHDGQVVADDGVIMNSVGTYLVLDLGMTLEAGSEITFNLWSNQSGTRKVKINEGTTSLPNAQEIGIGQNNSFVRTYTLTQSAQYIYIEMTARNKGRTEFVEATITISCVSSNTIIVIPPTGPAILATSIDTWPAFIGSGDPDPDYAAVFGHLNSSVTGNFTPAVTQYETGDVTISSINTNLNNGQVQLFAGNYTPNATFMKNRSLFSKPVTMPHLLVGSPAYVDQIDNTIAHFDGRVYISEDDTALHQGDQADEAGFDDPARDNYKDYLLWVEEGVVAEDLALVGVQEWPDYVFSKEYTLPGLDEIKNFINTNGHLQNMPSAEYVEKNGFTIKDITKRMLKTVEELTLYTIEQQEILTSQTEEIDNLKTEVKKLKEALEILLKDKK